MSEHRRFNIAIAGATGAVGEVLLELLAERDFPVASLTPLASASSAGDTVRFGRRELTVRELDGFDFAGIDFAFFSAGAKVSLEHARRAVAAGAVVIDNSSAFRRDPAVPLVIPEVNPQALADHQGLIANPNCSTMQMLVALAPLHARFHVRRIEVATYQSVSGAGRHAMEELGRQTASLLNFQGIEPAHLPVQIAFNLIPHIDAFEANGFTGEEMKLVSETRRILGDDSIEVNPTAVRVPVFLGHSMAVHLQTREPVTAEDARKVLQSAPGVVVVDEAAAGGYPTPVTHAAGQDAVFVGRIRQQLDRGHGLNLWVVADNLRKGAALNAVQIAEHLAAARGG